MANRITIQTPSIAANATVSLMQESVELQKLRTSVNDRNLVAVGIAGATVNTGLLVGFVSNEEVFRLPNGVTNTAGAPVKQDDVTTVEELVGAGETFDLQVTNSTGGALQFYVYIELEDIYE